MDRLHAIHGRRNGFTLIEMLVTLTIFSALMGVLVVGLRTGLQTWERVRVHQERSAAEQAVFALLRSDIEHIAKVSESLQPVVESEGNGTSEVLMLTSLPSRGNMERGLLSSWCEIDYKIVPSQEGDSSVLQREMRPYASEGNPIIGAEEVRTVLEDVDEVTFDYTSKGEEVATWSLDTPPSTIRVSIRRSGRPSLSAQFTIPVSAFQP